MADFSSVGEPCVLNHYIEDFIIQESSWPFTVKGQSYEFGRLPYDEPEVITTTFYESEHEVFSDIQSSEDDSNSECSFEIDSCCSYCGRACTATARHFGVKKFCSNTCAKLFGVPMPKRGGYPVGGRGRGRWKHNHYGNKIQTAQRRKMPNVYYNQSYEASTQVDEQSLRDDEDGHNDELDCLWKFEYVPASKWNAYEVAAFVRGIGGCSEYAESFVSHEIDGFALMLVKEEHLVVGLKMKLGPALKLVGRVNQMKAEALEENVKVLQTTRKTSNNNPRIKSESHVTTRVEQVVKRDTEHPSELAGKQNGIP